VFLPWIWIFPGLLQADSPSCRAHGAQAFSGQAALQQDFLSEFVGSGSGQNGDIAGSLNQLSPATVEISRYAYFCL